MAFRDSLRLEQIYFNNLRSLIDTLKTWRGNETDPKTADILESCIQADAAIILLYKNLGEEWNELTALLQKEMHDLEDLKKQVEDYHGELNEKIDEVNNYLMSLIRDLEERVGSLEARMSAAEQDLAGLTRNYLLDLYNDGIGNYGLNYKGTPVTFSDLAAWTEHPHIIWIRGLLDGETTFLIPREYDTDPETGIFEFATIGAVNSTIHEVTVTVLPDNSVHVATVIFDIGQIRNDITNLKGRMTHAENEISDIREEMENISGGYLVDIADDGEGGYTITHAGETVTFADIAAQYENGVVPVVQYNGTIYNMLEYTPADTQTQEPGYLHFVANSAFIRENGIHEFGAITLCSDPSNNSIEAPKIVQNAVIYYIENNKCVDENGNVKNYEDLYAMAQKNAVFLSYDLGAHVAGPVNFAIEALTGYAFVEYPAINIQGVPELRQIRVMGDGSVQRDVVSQRASIGGNSNIAYMSGMTAGYYDSQTFGSNAFAIKGPLYEGYYVLNLNKTYLENASAGDFYVLPVAPSAALSSKSDDEIAVMSTDELAELAVEKPAASLKATGQTAELKALSDSYTYVVSNSVKMWVDFMDTSYHTLAEIPIGEAVSYLWKNTGTGTYGFTGSAAEDVQINLDGVFNEVLAKYNLTAADVTPRFNFRMHTVPIAGDFPYTELDKWRWVQRVDYHRKGA